MTRRPRRFAARPTRAAVASLVVIVLGVVSACGADPDDSAPAAGATADATTTSAGADPTIPVPGDLEDHTGEASVTVAIVDNAFEPRHIEISSGTEVVWVNEGQNQHNVTPAVDGSFSGFTGEEVAAPNRPSVTFERPGEYPYYCSFHGTRTLGQTGFILVTDG